VIIWIVLLCYYCADVTDLKAADDAARTLEGREGYTYATLGLR
jgi:hypothetical protein